MTRASTLGSCTGASRSGRWPHGARLYELHSGSVGKWAYHDLETIRLTRRFLADRTATCAPRWVRTPSPEAGGRRRAEGRRGHGQRSLEPRRVTPARLLALAPGHAAHHERVKAEGDADRPASEGSRGRRNEFKIFLDDREVGTVGRDQERAIEVEPGAYELVVKVGSGRLTQVRSAACSLKLGPGARQRVVCKPAAGNNLLFATWLTVFGSNRWIRVELE